MLLTAPQLASVVTVANSADCAMPKRVSLPSMLPPGCVGRHLGLDAEPADDRVALIARRHSATKAPIRNITLIAPNNAQPWRVSRTILPNV